MRCYVYKLRPTPAQEAALAQTLDICRRLYNDALGGRRAAYQADGRTVRFAEQCAVLPVLKATDPRLGTVHSQVLQDVLHRVERSYQNFFRRVKAKDAKAGLPRFKGRGWYDTFCYRQFGDGRGARFDAQGRLVLSKIGTVRVRKDRPIEGTPKTCAVTRKADGWYACVACETAPEPLPSTGESVGVDVGLKSFATLSNGEVIANPRLLGRAERRLKTAQRRVSRRSPRCGGPATRGRKGSKRRNKARVLLAKAHLKVRRARLDFCHKVARDLVNRFDAIAVERLNIKGMVRNHPLAKAISDAGWGLFFSVLSAKAESAARTVVQVSPAYTSQSCFRCGERVPKTLSDRWHSCPYCGFEADRDVNAALNIHSRMGGGTAFGEAATVVAA